MPALYKSVEDEVAGGACGCADVFGAREEAIKNGFDLITDNKVPGSSGLPSLARLVAECLLSEHTAASLIRYFRILEMKPFKPLLLTAAIGLSLIALGGKSAAVSADAKPTIVLVHGAFADSSSWNRVTTKLIADGYPVIAAANPLRSVAGDGAFVGSLVKSIPGPVVLVGHSYGGNVISVAVGDNRNVKSLVYVAALAPEVGESASSLSGKFPGSTLGPTLAPPVALPGGGKDLYIQQSKFHAQFAADVPANEAALMAVNQRPVTDAALNEAASAAAWKTLPSYFVYGTRDKNIPPAVHAFMAQRAKSRRTLVIEGASHVVMISHSGEVAKLIEEAAAAN